jgi:hypothetical protein
MTTKLWAKGEIAEALRNLLKDIVGSNGGGARSPCERIRLGAISWTRVPTPPRGDIFVMLGTGMVFQKSQGKWCYLNYERSTCIFKIARRGGCRPGWQV